MQFAFSLCCILFAFAVCVFFSCLLPCSNLASHFFCMFLGRGGPGPAKCEKKVRPNPEDDQNAKNKHAWKRRSAKMQTKMQACKQRPAKTQKKCKNNAKKCGRCRNLQKSGKRAVSWSICIFFCVLAGLCLQACIFVCILAGRRFPASCFLRFGRPQDLGAPSFRILPGPGRLGPKTCKTNATLNSNMAANTKKQRKQQMQTKCNTKKIQTANAIKMQPPAEHIGVEINLG